MFPKSSSYESSVVDRAVTVYVLGMSAPISMMCMWVRVAASRVQVKGCASASVTSSASSQV